MTDQIVSFEVAKLAKKKGFNMISVHWFLDVEDDRHKVPLYSNRAHPCGENWSKLYSNRISAPTQSELQKWIFDNYGYWINLMCDGGFDYDIVSINDPSFIFEDLQSETMPHEYKDPYLLLDIALIKALLMLP